MGSGWTNQVTWWVDDEEIATKKSGSEDTLYLAADEEHALADEVGAIRAQFTVMSKPVRATWFEGTRSRATTASYLGTGGIDLVPEPGSPAAIREDRMRANPRLFAARHVVGGVATVLVPIAAAVVIAWLLSRVTLPDLDLPSVPWPDLPSIPWPSIDLPSIPWPDWEMPEWLRWLLDKATYVWPVLLGLWFARREMRRRREQDELRTRMATGAASGSADADSTVRDVPAGEAEHAEAEEAEPADTGEERPGDVDVLGGDGADEAEGGPLHEPRR